MSAATSMKAVVQNWCDGKVIALREPHKLPMPSLVLTTGEIPTQNQAAPRSVWLT